MNRQLLARVFGYSLLPRYFFQKEKGLVPCIGVERSLAKWELLSGQEGSREWAERKLAIDDALITSPNNCFILVESFPGYYATVDIMGSSD